MKKTPIDSLKKKYDSYDDHLNAIAVAIIEQFKIPDESYGQVKKAVTAAFDVGHGTMTTDDWCDEW